MTRPEHGSSVLLVGTPRGWFFDALAANLGDDEFLLRHEGDADAVVRAVRETTPDLVVVHDELPGATLPDLFRSLRDEGLPTDVPLVAVTSGSLGRSDPEVAALEAGAWIALREPIDPVLIAARLRRLIQVGRLVREGAAAVEEGTDEATTGVYSLGGLMRALASMEALAQRQGAPLTCAVVGPTHRGRGDVLARQRATTAEMCRRHVRRSDVCGWLGPGELVVIAYDTPVEGARKLVLRLNAIASKRAEVAEDDSPALSAGIAELFPQGDAKSGRSPDGEAREPRAEIGILAAAREALERAREAGGGIEQAAIA